MNPIQPALVAKPNFLPHRDLVDWENAGPVIALGVDLENYDGEIYLKPKHVYQIGQAIGLVHPDEVAVKDQVIEQLKLKIKELENAKADDIVNGKLDDIIGYVSGIAMQCSCPSIILAEGEEEESSTAIEDESSKDEDLFSGKPETVQDQLKRSLIRNDL